MSEGSFINTTSFGLFGFKTEYTSIVDHQRSKKVSSLFRVYIILIFSEIFLQNFNRFCFQLCKGMLLIIFNLLLLLKKKWMQTINAKFTGNLKFRTHFISPSSNGMISCLRFNHVFNHFIDSRTSMIHINMNDIRDLVIQRLKNHCRFALFSHNRYTENCFLPNNEP